MTSTPRNVKHLTYTKIINPPEYYPIPDSKTIAKCNGLVYINNDIYYPPLKAEEGHVWIMSGYKGIYPVLDKQISLNDVSLGNTYFVADNKHIPPQLHGHRVCIFIIGSSFEHTYHIPQNTVQDTLPDTLQDTLQDTLTTIQVLHINNTTTIKAPIVHLPVPAPIPVPISELPLHAIYIHPVQMLDHAHPAPIPNPDYVHKSAPMPVHEYKPTITFNSTQTLEEPVKKQMKLLSASAKPFFPKSTL